MNNWTMSQRDTVILRQGLEIFVACAKNSSAR